MPRRLLGRPVKWTDERGESFLSDSHGRDHDMEQEIALDADGRILALRVTGYGNIGAYLSNGTVLQPTGNIVRNIIGVYATPLLEVTAEGDVHQHHPVGPYRGAGRPEGNYYIERLLDTAAREMGIDPVEIRRRNHIQPDAFPYKTPAGTTYDSGDFPAMLDKALALADWDGFAARKKESCRTRQAARPRHRPVSRGHRPAGQGDGRHPVRGRRHGHHHHRHAGLRPGPRLAVRPGAGVAGSAFRSSKISLLQGDCDELLAGGGTGGSKSLMASGTAIVEGGGEGARGRHARSPPTCWKRRKPISSSRSCAAAASSASPAPTARSASWNWRTDPRRRRDAAGRRAADAVGVAMSPKGPPFAYPNGCHIAEVEVDPETGVAEVVRYYMVNDFGVIVNPLLVEGQAHGGIVQGIGQAFLEQVVYDESGQPLTGSYMDYALPRANDAPMFALCLASGAGEDQPAGVQGLRRGRVRRCVAVGDECAGRCAVSVWHHAYRHAGNAAAGLGGDPASVGKTWL